MIKNQITINGQHYDSPEAMPPDVRRLYEEAMRRVRSSPAHPKTRLHVSVNMTGHEDRTLGDSSTPAKPPLPIEPSSTGSNLRNLPRNLAITIAFWLLFWFCLGRLK